MQKWSESIVVRTAGGFPVVVSGASVRVRSFPGLADVVIYRSNSLTDAYGPAGTLLTTDVDGKFAFYAPNGRYRVDWSGSGISPGFLEDILLQDSSEAIIAPLTLAGKIALARQNGQFMVLASGAPGIASPNAAGLWPLVTVGVPANAMGPNGILRVSSQWSLSEHASHQKGGSLYLGAFKPSSVFNFLGSQFEFCNTILHTSYSVITNKGATNVQRLSSIMASGPSSVTPSTLPGIALANPGNGSSLSDTIDTTVDWNMIFGGQKGTAAETLILESYLVELLPT